MTNVQGRAKFNHRTSALLITLGMTFLPSEAPGNFLPPPGLRTPHGPHFNFVSDCHIRGAPYEGDYIWSFSLVRRAHVNLIARPAGRTWKAGRNISPSATKKEALLRCRTLSACPLLLLSAEGEKQNADGSPVSRSQMVPTYPQKPIVFRYPAT